MQQCNPTLSFFPFFKHTPSFILFHIMSVISFVLTFLSSNATLLPDSNRFVVIHFTPPPLPQFETKCTYAATQSEGPSSFRSAPSVLSFEIYTPFRADNLLLVNKTVNYDKNAECKSDKVEIKKTWKTTLLSSDVFPFFLLYFKACTTAYLFPT